MFSKKSALTKVLALILAFSFLSTLYQAKANIGTISKILGGVLVLVGAKDVYQGMGETNTWCTCAASLYPATAVTCQPGCTKGRWQIAQGVLEMGGGMAAMMNNSKTEKELNPNPTPNTPGATTAGTTNNTPQLPDGTRASIPDKCKEFPQLCKCNDSACNQPTLQLPPKDDLEKLMRAGGSSKALAPDGTTLDDALAKLNENYDKAKDAADAFNQQSAAGAFLPGGDGGLGGDSSGSGEDYMGLNKGDGSDSASKGGGFDSPSNPFLNNNADLDNLKKMRGEPDPVTTVGLNLQNNNTNKLLTIFERAARVLRGDRNRDISLAKIEWTRKEALKKQGKAPSTISAPKQ